MISCIGISPELVEVDLSIERLLADTECERPAPAICIASFRVGAFSSEGGTTSLTKPHSAAVVAGIISPVIIVVSAGKFPPDGATIGVVQNNPIVKSWRSECSFVGRNRQEGGDELAASGRGDALDFDNHWLQDRLQLRHEIDADIEHV